MKKLLLPKGVSKSVQVRATPSKKSARKVQGNVFVISKADARYWTKGERLIKWEGSPNYSFQVQFKGQRMAFSTRTSNKEAAARIAAGIYTDLVTLGVERALEKHKPKPTKAERVATVGEWIAAAEGVMSVKPVTFTHYARCLRKIVSEIIKVRKTKRRFGPRTGGAKGYRERVEQASLEALTVPSIQRWRLAYVAKGKGEKEKSSRQTSCNSTIRNAASLFSERKVVKYLPDLKLPEPPPFADVEFYESQDTGYTSSIDPRALLNKARRELSEKDKPAFVAMLLALATGLRRSEIDSLQWNQIDLERNRVSMELTSVSEHKTVESRKTVPFDHHVAAFLKSLKEESSGKYVVSGQGKRRKNTKWGRHYRAEAAWNRLVTWLKVNGVKARKPIHELRKELGALVTSEHGIYAASRILRHKRVSTTEKFYADLKAPPVVEVGAWLNL
jgi:integrase